MQSFILWARVQVTVSVLQKQINTTRDAHTKGNKIIVLVIIIMMVVDSHTFPINFADSKGSPRTFDLRNLDNFDDAKRLSCWTRESN